MNNLHVRLNLGTECHGCLRRTANIQRHLISQVGKETACFLNIEETSHVSGVKLDQALCSRILFHVSCRNIQGIVQHRQNKLFLLTVSSKGIRNYTSLSRRYDKLNRQNIVNYLDVMHGDNRSED